MSANAMLVLAGAACVILGGFMLRLALPREGRPDSVWTRTETRAMSTTILVLVLILVGGTMLMKGIFS
jgi:hypothetical protein